jgi:hypothetical protein
LTLRLQTLLLSVKRHPNILDSIVSFLIQISRYNITDLFTVQIRKLIESPKEYVQTIHQIFPYLVEAKATKEELITGGIIDNILEICQKMAESDLRNSIDMRLLSITFICDIWMLYPLYLEESLNLVNPILALLKRASRVFI